MDTEHLDFLLNRYFDGELTPTEKRELELILLEEPKARREFWRAAALHGALRISGEQAWGARAAKEIAERPAVAAARSRRWFLTEFPRLGWAALAAGLAAAVIVTVSSWKEPRAIKTGGQAVVSSRSGAPNSVADPFLAIVVDQSAGARWTGSPSLRGIGHALGRDRVRLEAGEATLMLDNGVELQLRGPVELELLSVDHGVLHRGQLSARVPDNAIGFRIDAPGVNVVDLGTEFSLAVDDGGEPKVHVFKGKVRAAMPTLPSSRTELGSGDTARFDVALGIVSRDTGDLSVFPILEDDSMLPRATGDVRYLRRAPKSVRAGTYEHDSIMVFQEKADVVLPEAVTVIRGASNQQRGPEPSVPDLAVLPAGTRVRSYLIHFDRVGASRDDVRARGRITFDRPVLGFVVHAKSLTDSDPWLGHPDTTYDSPGSRQILEMRFLRNRTGPVKSHTSGLFDEVHLGADGRSVEMVLFGGLAADQFRVLLAADGN